MTDANGENASSIDQMVKKFKGAFRFQDRSRNMLNDRLKLCW